MASPRRQLPLGTQLWVRCFGQEWAPARVVDEAEYDLSSLHDQFPPNATTAVEFFDDGNFFLVDASDAATVQPLEFSSARAREPKYREALDLARAMKASEADVAPQPQAGGGPRAAPTHEDDGGPSPPSAATAAVVPPRPLAAPAAVVIGRVPSGTSFDARDRSLMRQYLAHLGSDNEDVQLALSMLQRDGVDVARLMAEGGRGAAATRRGNDQPSCQQWRRSIIESTATRRRNAGRCRPVSGAGPPTAARGRGGGGPDKDAVPTLQPQR
jgi:hypothetical protein